MVLITPDPIGEPSAHLLGTGPPSLLGAADGQEGGGVAALSYRKIICPSFKWLRLLTSGKSRPPRTLVTRVILLVRPSTESLISCAPVLFSSRCCVRRRAEEG